MHLPTSLYNYMQENFFKYLCINAGTPGNASSLTSLLVPMKACECEGSNYFGMPSLQFMLTVDKYDVAYSYNLEAENFELFPKVNTAMRLPQCSLTLWNL